VVVEAPVCNRSVPKKALKNVDFPADIVNYYIKN